MFSQVCVSHSVHRRDIQGISGARSLPGPWSYVLVLSGGRVSLVPCSFWWQGVGGRVYPRNYESGRYASYWNTFLFSYCFLGNNRPQHVRSFRSSKELLLEDSCSKQRFGTVTNFPDKERFELNGFLIKMQRIIPFLIISAVADASVDGGLGGFMAALPNGTYVRSKH